MLGSATGYQAPSTVSSRAAIQDGLPGLHFGIGDRFMPPDQETEDASCNSRAALRTLEEARTARSDPETAEKAVLQALQLAPQDADIHLGAYRFYFYNHRYADALPHAQFIIEHAARRLNIPVDWRVVRPEDCDFTLLESAPGLYLQALLAWGYCHLRLGNVSLGREAIAKVAKIDPSDRFGARPILDLIDNEASAES